MISPETKAKYLERIKGTNLTESMIETAYENGALEGEERGIAKGELQQFVITLSAAVLSVDTAHVPHYRNEH